MNSTLFSRMFPALGEPAAHPQLPALQERGWREHPPRSARLTVVAACVATALFWSILVSVGVNCCSASFVVAECGDLKGAAYMWRCRGPCYPPCSDFFSQMRINVCGIGCVLLQLIFRVLCFFPTVLLWLPDLRDYAPISGVCLW